MKSTVLTSGLLTTARSTAPRALTGFQGVVARLRQAAADRALNRQLADLDNAMLRDIGIAEEDIYRLRNGRHIGGRSVRR